MDMLDPSGIKAAIFDLDGTIADSLGVWGRIDKMFFEKRGMELPPDYQKSIVFMGFNEAAEFTRKKYGLPQTKEEIINEWRNMAVHEYADRIELKPGAREYIKTLKDSGIKIGLATASGRELFEPLLKRHGVFNLFDAFTTTEEAGRNKEFPDVYLKCAEKLNVEPKSCVVFEDLLSALRSAKSAGMKVVGVFDPTSAHEQKEIESEADLFIEDFKDAPHL